MRYGIVKETALGCRYVCTDRVLVNRSWFKADPECESPKVGDVVEIISRPSYEYARLVCPYYSEWL